MQFVLLSGGSGKRLWPLSNDVRSKQFIKIFDKADGTGRESMIQRIYDGLKRSCGRGVGITISTSRTQVSSVRSQLGDVDMCVEPCRRDTFPAIALASAYLADVKHVAEDEPVVVFPVDPYVDESYFEALGSLAATLEPGASGAPQLVLMGIKPTYPSAKYGYIMPKVKLGEGYFTVDSFKEKPDEGTAATYIEQGALWNGGVFAFRLGWLLDVARSELGTARYDELLARYDELPKISFDYAVVEKTKDIQMMMYSGTWKDLGSWNTLTEAMTEPSIGKAIMQGCERTHVVNELDIPVIAMGLEDTVVAASPEGVLVADKHQSSFLKPLAERIHQEIMMQEKSWGSYRVIDVGAESLTVRVTLLAGHAMSYHSHERRDEAWTIIEGEGTAEIDGVSRDAGVGDTIRLPVGSRHRLTAKTRLVAIEVQTGRDIDVDDKTVWAR